MEPGLNTAEFLAEDGHGASARAIALEAEQALYDAVEADPRFKALKAFAEVQSQINITCRANGTRDIDSPFCRFAIFIHDDGLCLADLSLERLYDLIDEFSKVGGEA